MTYEVFYTIGEHQDSIIIEGETIDDIANNTIKELKLKGAKYLCSYWLND